MTPSLIQSLRDAGEERFFIVGLDMLEEAIGFYFSDRSYLVPPGNAPEYLPRLKEIVDRERVQVIVPRSDEEVLTLARVRGEFEAKGVGVLCSSDEAVAIASDKGSMLEFLRGKGLPTARFHLPRSPEELREAAHSLGYPNRPVVVKPRRSRGGRGFLVVQERFDILSERETRFIRLDHLLDLLSGYNPFPPVVIMEHLPGQDYSVDALAHRGKPLFIIPRRRTRVLGGTSQVGEVVEEERVKQRVAQVIEAFGFDYILNVQLRESAEGEPLVYEINPRPSGTIVANAAAGANILYWGIRLALGMPIPSRAEVRETKMIRYLKEFFLYGNKGFTASLEIPTSKGI